MGGYPSVLVGSVSVCHFKINEQTYSRPRLRESTYHLGQFAVLYDNSKFGIKRLELYNSRKEEDKRKKSAHIINLERCSNVFMDKIYEEKKTEFFITIRFISDYQQETFTLGTIQEASL